MPTITKRTDHETARAQLRTCAGPCPICHPPNVTACADFAVALLHGLDEASKQGLDFTNRERRVIGEVIDAYGTANSESAPFEGVCQLTYRCAQVQTFTFAPRCDDAGAQEPRRD